MSDDPFTSEMKTEIVSAYVADYNNSTSSSTANYSSFYTAVADAINAMVASETIGDLPDVQAVALWVEGAEGVNSNSTLAGLSIRSITADQYFIRSGNSLSAAAIQLASNSIASNFFQLSST